MKKKYVAPTARLLDYYVNENICTYGSNLCGINPPEVKKIKKSKDDDNKKDHPKRRNHR